MQQEKKPNSSSNTTASVLKVAAGATAAGLLLLLSKPIISYTAREICYNMNTVPSFWSHPFAYTWSGATRLYSCEWVGHWGFNWFDVFSALSNSWHTLVAAAGSMGGLYALNRSLRNRESNSNQGLSNTCAHGDGSPSREELKQLVHALRQGQIIETYNEMPQSALTFRAPQNIKDPCEEYAPSLSKKHPDQRKRA